MSPGDLKPEEGSRAREARRGYLEGQRQGWREGYQAGFSEGFRDGFHQGAEERRDRHNANYPGTDWWGRPAERRRPAERTVTGRCECDTCKPGAK